MRAFRTPLAVALAIVMLPAVVMAQLDPQASGVAVQALQERMTADPAIMDTISDLQSDPEFQSVLQDPDIAAALRSRDTATLLTNPKLGALLDHPTVQEITKKLTQ